jgi:hypothetical protein
MKRLLYATVAALGIAAAPAAHAILSIAVLDDGVSVLLPCTLGVGSIVCNGGSTHYDTIAVAASGVPNLPDPDLSSLTIAATAGSGGTHTLQVDVFQTGILSAGAQDLTSTFTINHLVGAPFGPSTLSDYINGGSTDATIGTPLASHTFLAGDINDTVAITTHVPGDVTSDAHRYIVTTTADGQSLTDTIQLVRAPEPASLALLGMGLFGLGVLRNRKRNG